MTNKLKKFEWSLQPLSVCLKFVGIPIRFSNKSKPTTSRFMIVSLVTILGCCIIAANVIINGPRGIEVVRLKWMENIQNYQSPFLYFKENPFGIIKLVKIIYDMIFFCYVPFIHATFLISILFDGSWKKLILILEKINREMKLSEEFHRNCRKQCLMVLFVYIILVSRLKGLIFR